MITITLRSLRNASLRQHTNPHSLLKQQFPYSSSYSLQPPIPQQRFASSTTATTTAATQASSKPLSKVNGPPTTLPTALVIPTREPSQSFFPSYALSLGKAYLSFYKTGVKHIYANFMAARPLQHSVNAKYCGSIPAAISANFLTRSDFQLLLRSWHDIKRVPIFGLVFIICGEFTPLVVVLLSNVVPWTCRIPKQIESDRWKLEQRRAISFRNLTAAPPMEKGVDRLERMQLLHISWSLGLSSKVWDWLGGKYPGLPTEILRRKVERRVQYLEMDDGLIRKCGGVGEMEVEELKMGLVERGVDVLGKPDAQLRADLGAWLRSRERVPVERLLLTRPSVWPVKPKPSREA